MIVDTLITGVKKYFTSLSVDSLWGYKKISLLEADENKMPTGVEVEIDATESVVANISKNLIQHSSESKKVYMDGTKINPIKMTITGHIETTKLADIQSFASDDKWMYVSMTKDIGGSHMAMSASYQSQIGRLTSLVGITDDSASQVFTDSKLYVIQNLQIEDEGFINTVQVTIDLVEVVLFEYDVQYKYGVKQNKGAGAKVQQTKVIEEVPEKAWDTYTGNYYKK